MFTFQVIRLTSVVVYMKWFRSKCQDRHGQEAQHDLAACMPGSCLHPRGLTAAARAQAAPTGGLGRLTVFPHWLLSLPATSVRDRSLVLEAGRGLVGRKASPFLSPLWVSHGVGPAEAQTPGLPPPGPRAVCAWPKDPRWHLVVSHVRP